MDFSGVKNYYAINWILFHANFQSGMLLKWNKCTNTIETELGNPVTNTCSFSIQCYKNRRISLSLSRFLYDQSDFSLGERMSDIKFIIFFSYMYVHTFVSINVYYYCCYYCYYFEDIYLFIYFSNTFFYLLWTLFCYLSLFEFLLFQI